MGMYLDSNQIRVVCYIESFARHVQALAEDSENAALKLESIFRIRRIPAESQN